MKTLLVLLALASGAQASSTEGRWVLTGVGRFAVFADLNSIRREGDIALMTSFQVVEEDFGIGGRPYSGGLSHWSFDCATHMADRLDFISVNAALGFGEGTAEPGPAYPAVPGGDAAELLAVACDPASAGEADADNLSDAVRVGRAVMAAAN
jgi:hypothetical protein